MSVKYWLAGFALCFAGISGAAAATSVDSREMDNSARGSSDSSSAHDVSVSDLQGAAHDNSGHGHTSESSKTASGVSERSSGEGMPSARVPASHLGWQSLLPGSIQ